MTVLRPLLRGFSYLFHALLSLFLLAVSGLALSSGVQKLNLKMLPWTGDTLTFVVFFASLFGLLSLLLALSGRVRILFFLWALVVAVMLLKGYVFSGYYFATGEVRSAMELLVAAWIALFGAWPSKRRRPR